MQPIHGMSVINATTENKDAREWYQKLQNNQSGYFNEIPSRSAANNKFMLS